MAERKARLPEEMVIKLTDEEEKHRASYEKSGKEFIDDYKGLFKCTKCGKDYKRRIKDGVDVCVHPLLDVFFCEACKDFYGDGDFSMDEGEDKYCRWCGEGGTLFLCSECVHGFCPKCIKRNLGKESVRSAENDDNWKCFFCNPEPLWLLRYVTAEASKISKNKEWEGSSADDDSKSSSKRGGSKRQLSSDSEASSKKSGSRRSSSRKKLKIISDDDEASKDDVQKQPENNEEPMRIEDAGEAKSSDNEGGSQASATPKKKIILSGDEEAGNNLTVSGTEEPEKPNASEEPKSGNNEIKSPSKSLMEAETLPKSGDKPDCEENGGKENGKAENCDEENKNGTTDPVKNLRKLYHSCGFMGNILAKKLKRRIDALTPDTLAQCRIQVKDMTEKLKPLVLELQRKLDDVENVTLSD